MCEKYFSQTPTYIDTKILTSLRYQGYHAIGRSRYIKNAQCMEDSGSYEAPEYSVFSYK